MKGSSASKNDDIYTFHKPSMKKAAMQQPMLSPGVPKTSMRMGTAVAVDGSNGPARPMTSVRAAGYSSRGRTSAGTAVAGATFDPFNQANKNTLDGRSNPEEQIKTIEKKVTRLIEESAVATNEGNLIVGLEKAKEAGKRERHLTKQREQLANTIANDPNQANSAIATPNLDLTYCVLLTLASAYHACKMYPEAINTYSVIAKNKLFNQSGRLRVNMGNIYFEQHKYSQAVKMYRMALDQIPNTNRDIRLNIMRNIGIAFVKLGHYQDAITSFENIVENNSCYHSAFNLILCYFALGDRERMKKGFQKLVSIKPVVVEQFEDSVVKQDHIEDHEVFNEDALRALARERKRTTERYILMAAKLVAPNIENNPGGVISSSGYDWVVETIAKSMHSEIALELEIAKAVSFLKTKEFSKAIEALKAFEKKDQKMIGTAATNLSFLYILEGDYKNAEKYSELAVTSDRYNAKAQTNMGNCFFYKRNFEKAKEHYLEAISVDALCVEAMYNLGLVYKETGYYNDAIMWYEKLHSILRNNSEVIYQIADIFDKMGNSAQSMEMFNILISVVPTDPTILARMGDLFVKENNGNQAFQSYSESYRYFPSNLEVIAWLGAYYVECEVYDQAVQFFERAAMMQPLESKWQLMIASCYRRSGNYQAALATYKRIHEKFPENVECLRFLVRICTDLGMKEVHDYINKLAKVERGKGDDPSSTMIDIVKVDTTPDHAKATLHQSRMGGGGMPQEEEDWNNDDVQELLP